MNKMPNNNKNNKINVFGFYILQYIYMTVKLNNFLLKKNKKNIKIRLTLLNKVKKLLILFNIFSTYIEDKYSLIKKNNIFIQRNLNNLYKKHLNKETTNKTKTRAKVNYSNKKLWKQKGLGKARVGSKASPLLRGGGVIFGPKGNYSKIKLNKKLKKAMFFSICLYKSPNFKILDDLNESELHISGKDKLLLLTNYYNDSYKVNHDILFYNNNKNLIIKHITLVNSLDLLKPKYIFIRKSDLFPLINRLIS